MMSTPRRELFVVTAEWSQARRTGLHELEGLVKFVDANPQATRWKKATLIVPAFGTVEETPKYSVRIPWDYNSPNNFQHGRILDGLPRELEWWQEFGRQAALTIQALRETVHTDVLAVDWPAAPVLCHLNDDYRRTFTIDLFPDNDAALHLWQEGCRACNKIHIPSQWWKEWLFEKDLELKSSKDRTVCLPFGIATSPCTVEDKRQARQDMHRQDQFAHLDRNPILIVGRHRGTHDDQKNFQLMGDVAKELLEQHDALREPVLFIFGWFGTLTALSEILAGSGGEA